MAETQPKIILPEPVAQAVAFADLEWETRPDEDNLYYWMREIARVKVTGVERPRSILGFRSLLPKVRQQMPVQLEYSQLILLGLYNCAGNLSYWTNEPDRTVELKKQGVPHNLYTKKGFFDAAHAMLQVTSEVSERQHLSLDTNPLEQTIINCCQDLFVLNPPFQDYWQEIADKIGDPILPKVGITVNE